MCYFDVLEEMPALDKKKLHFSRGLLAIVDILWQTLQSWTFTMSNLAYQIQVQPNPMRFYRSFYLFRDTKGDSGAMANYFRTTDLYAHALAHMREYSEEKIIQIGKCI